MTAAVWAGADISTVGTLEFENTLKIPALDEGQLDAGGVRRFQLDVQAGETTFKDGDVTETWGVNGAYLGPTLRARRGDTVEIGVTNHLDETTTMHWHGMHVPAEMDGGPHQPIRPGSTWTPTWTLDQPAATLWYHPHPHGRTAEHVYRGVAGMILVDDDNDPGLPDTYGVDDIPVIVQDRNFDGHGQFEMRAGFMGVTGVLGDTILVNGTYDPHFDVTTERVRLRLLNASNARFFEFGFSDGRSFELVGTDGGLLETPVTLQRIPLSPGERAEIVVEFAPGDTAVLRTWPHTTATWLLDRFSGGDDTFDILELRAADTLEPSAPLPGRLVDELELADPADAVVEREFQLDGNQINGQSMNMNRIDAVIEAGTTEIWTVRNTSGVPHNFHVHDVQFRVLDVNGEPPPVWLTGRNDTVEVAHDTTVRIAIRFGGHTASDVPYMFHCHVLRHEDSGMMGQFAVVEPDGPHPGNVDATHGDSAHHHLDQHHLDQHHLDQHRDHSH